MPLFYQKRSFYQNNKDYFFIDNRIFFEKLAIVPTIILTIVQFKHS
jgi:hypothetical protein